MSLAAFAPAKVNLFLHVGAPDGQGYHPLCSLMAFADLGDRLRLEPAPQLQLAIEGPFASELAGLDLDDNLVLRAARALARRMNTSEPRVRLTLTKALPVASGLGGGSSDGGAALRLVRAALKLGVDDASLEAVAASLGSDGAPCLWGRPVIARGRGERLSPAPAMPILPAVLVNPRIACPTGAVYQAYDEELGARAPAELEPADPPLIMESVQAVAAWLGGLRNDLETPALGLAPEIGAVLERLLGSPDTLLARLSGSGATCFAVCVDDKAAERLASAVLAAEPRWWVRCCSLGGPWPDL